jgi:hypothetical protein
MKDFLLKLSWRLAVMLCVATAWAWIKWPLNYYTEIPQGTSYAKISWVGKYLAQHPTLEQTEVFLGSSICFNGINDSLLNAQAATGKKYVNFGLPHSCNAITFELLKEMVMAQKRRPEKVYLCLKSDAIPLNIHNMYPLIATGHHITSSAADLNVYAAQSTFKRAAWNINYGTEIYKYNPIDSTKIIQSNYGYRPSPTIDSLESEKLYKKFYAFNADNFKVIEKLNKGATPDWKLQFMLTRLDYVNNVKFQRECFKKSILLLEEYNIAYDVIMYPNFVLQRDFSNEVMVDYYNGIYPEIKKFGHSIIAFDGAYLTDATSWNDMNHLNYRGAASLTEEFLQEVIWQVGVQ